MHDVRSVLEDMNMAKCPYCDKPVELEAEHGDRHDEVRKEIKGVVKKEVMYFCPHCERILGFSFYPGGWATGRP